MSIRKIIDWAIEENRSETTGTIVSPFYEYQDIQGQWVWACDVDLGSGEENSVLRSVPVAANNRDIIYAEQGKGVTLSRMGAAKWAITGLSKVLNSTIRITLVTFTEDMYTIGISTMLGFVFRPLTYGEIGSLLAPYGYGTIPYGLQGKFDLQGNFIDFVGE